MPPGPIIMRHTLFVSGPNVYITKPLTLLDISYDVMHLGGLALGSSEECFVVYLVKINQLLNA